VDWGDLGRADGGFFEAEFLDEFTGWAGGGVFEDAAGGGGDGLGGFAFLDAELEVGVDDFEGGWGALEDGADAVLVVEFRDTAVADEDFVAGFFLNGARGVEVADGEDLVEGFLNFEPYINLMNFFYF
jgi:hypothetical protein